MKIFKNPRFFQTNLILELLLIGIIPSFCAYIFMTDKTLSMSSAIEHNDAILICYKIFSALIITQGIQAFSLHKITNYYDNRLTPFEALKYVTISAAPLSASTIMLFTGDLTSTALAIIGAGSLSCYLTYEGLKNHLSLDKRSAIDITGEYLSISIFSIMISIAIVRCFF